MGLDTPAVSGVLHAEHDLPTGVKPPAPVAERAAA
jgi:hypothetical protein